MTTRATQRPLLMLLTAMAVFASLIATAPAARAAVTCGDTVTANVVLDANLVCNGTDGIIVGADGVTIDLNGFTIRNTGGGIVSGVESDGFDDVKVTNGTIHNFYRNVLLANGANLQASDLVLRGGGGTGLLFSNASGASAADAIDARDFPDAAVDVADSNGVMLSEITARRASWGIFIVNSIATEVTNSDLRRNFYGLFVLDGNGNTVRDTTSRNNSVAGFANEVGTKTNFINVDARRNPTGILFVEGGDGGAVLDSRITRNGVGIQLGKDIGPSGFPTPSDAENVRVLRNVIRNNDASGIAVDQAAPAFLTHRIEDNRVIGNGLNPGAFVNSVGQSLDDGINVVAPAGEVQIGNNRANGNGDYGIYAPSQTDNGGNTASGNGNPAQCAGVSC